MLGVTIKAKNASCNYDYRSYECFHQLKEIENVNVMIKAMNA